MNPAPDSYGNPGVWNYMESRTNKRDGRYALLPNFTNDIFGIAGIDAWYGPDSTGCGGAPGGLPMVWINTNPDPMSVCPGGLTIAPGHTWIHPWSTKDAVVGWRSPITGTVHISGGVRDTDPNGGNGIIWFLDRGTTAIDKGRLDDGGREQFLKGLSTTVTAGQFLYVIVDARDQDFGFDSTRIRLTITG
jgi:hypothetical protein